MKTIPVQRRHIQILSSQKSVGIMVHNGDGSCHVAYLSWDEIAEIAIKRGRSFSKRVTEKFTASAPRALKSEIKSKVV
jgi:hypothetical protein